MPWTSSLPAEKKPPRAFSVAPWSNKYHYPQHCPEAMSHLVSYLFVQCLFPLAMVGADHDARICTRRVIIVNYVTYLRHPPGSHRGQTCQFWLGRPWCLPQQLSQERGLCLFEGLEAQDDSVRNIITSGSLPSKLTMQQHAGEEG